MFRWLDQLLSHLRRGNSEPHALEKGWVEPSNAITRAILSGAVAQLATSSAAAPAQALAVGVPASATEPLETLETLEPARETPAIVTRTAQRTRRRRATRAA